MDLPSSDTLRGSIASTILQHSSSSSAAPSRPSLGPRLLSQDRRPSAFSGGEHHDGHRVVSAPTDYTRSSSDHSDDQVRKATSQQPLRKDSLRANAGTRSHSSHMEADFTTTFPAQYKPVSSPTLPASPSAARTATSPRTLSAQASFVRPAAAPTSMAALPTTTDSPLQRQPSTSSSNYTTSAPTSRNNSTSAPTSSAPPPAPPLPRSRQPSTTSALSPITSSRPLPVPNPAPTSSSSRRHLSPLLPSAPVSLAPPTAMYWSRTPHSGRVPKGMRAHTATVVGNEVWCFGGCDIRGGCFRDVWRLDCDTFIWTKPKVMGEIPPVTRAHTATLVDRRLFVFGGGDGPHYYNDTYIFDTLTNTWTKPLIRGTPPSRRRAHTSVLYNSRLLIFGGGNGLNALNDVHSLDVSDVGKLEWREVETRGRRPIARGYHSMNLVGSKAVVFGGSDGTECFSDVFVLDLETLLWTEVKPDLTPDLYGLNPSTPTQGIESFPRLSHTCTTVGSYLFVIGGHDGVSFSSEILLFNLVTLQWEPRPISGLPPSPRGYHATILHDSRLLIFGGFNGQAVFDEVWTLDLGGSAFLPQITNFGICELEEDEDGEGEREERA